MAVSTATAIIATALISAGSTAYATQKQKDLAEEDRKRREQAEAEAKAETERIARETRPEAEGVQEIEFGAEETDIGSTQEFLVPKTTSALGVSATGRSGLGFEV